MDPSEVEDFGQMYDDMKAHYGSAAALKEAVEEFRAGEAAQLYDHSFLAPAVHCERLFYWQYVRRLQEKGGSPPMMAGSAGHKALEVLYKRGFGAIEEAVEVLRQSYDLRPHGYWSFLTANHLEVVVRNYADFYRDREPYRVLSHIEEPLVGQLGGRPFAGIPDLVVQDEEAERAAVVDHKFTSAYFGNKTAEVRYKMQGKLYVLLARQVLGFEGRRAVFNLISMKEKAGETGFTGQRFERIAFDYEEWELEAAEEWVAGAAERVDGLLGRPDVQDPAKWVQNGGKHCKFCTYEQLCFAKNEVLMQSALAGGFEERDEPEGLLLSGADDDE